MKNSTSLPQNVHLKPWLIQPPLGKKPEKSLLPEHTDRNLRSMIAASPHLVLGQLINRNLGFTGVGKVGQTPP